MEESKDWRIDDLEVNNFKSIKHLDIKPGRVNVFIGKPNAGKSNLLEALAFLGMDIFKGNNIPNEIIRYTEMSSLYYDNNINEEIAIRAGLFRYGGCICRNLVGGFEYNFPTQKRDIGSAVIDNKGNFERISKERTTNIKKYQFRHIPADQTNGSSFSLKIDGSNLWTVVRHNAFLKEFANNFFKEYGLNILFDETTKNNKLDIIKIVGDSYYKVDFSMTPDTFQRMLYYLAAIESNKNAVILFEEPESQSYPPYIQMLAERIVDDTDNQYFITTHSPFIVEKMLERAGTSDDVKIFVTYFEDYQTKVHELSRKEIDHIIDNSIDLFFNIDSFKK